MNPTCTELERRVISGLDLTDALREHAGRCDRCDLTLSIPARIAGDRASRRVGPGPGFAARTFAAALERLPRRARRRQAIAAATLAVAAAAVTALAWQLGERADLEIAAAERPSEADALPGQSQAPSEVDLDLAALSDASHLGLDWSRVGAMMARFRPGSPDFIGALAPSQKMAVQVALETAATESIEIRARLRKLELSLRRELERSPPDQAAVDDLLERIGIEELALRAARIGAWVVVRRIASGAPPSPPTPPSPASPPPSPPSRPTRPAVAEPPSQPSQPSQPATPTAVCDEVSCLIEPGRACCSPALDPFESELSERPSKSEIRRGVARVRNRIAECNSYKGGFRVRVAISSSGEARAEVVDRVPVMFARCVRHAFKKVRFPPSKRGVSATIPFNVPSGDPLEGL